jgi:hypothetical protein
MKFEIRNLRGMARAFSGDRDIADLWLGFGIHWGEIRWAGLGLVGMGSVVGLWEKPHPSLAKDGAPGSQLGLVGN